MIDHSVGVTTEHAYEVKRLDLDYFVADEESSAAGHEPSARTQPGDEGDS
jgi:hypothetical protein